MVGILTGGCRCVMLWCDFGMTCDLSTVRMFSTATFETCLYHKAMWITATDY